jgi:ribosomal protein S12 methylthiotransferase accessory factor YcaO
MGCDIDPERAVTRAIAEAAQSHTAVLVGARETFEDGRRHARRSADGLIGQLLSPSTIDSFSADGAADNPPEDLYDRLTLLLERIEGGGLSRCIVVDLTRPDLGIPVVRVLVPGAAGPYGDTSRRPPLRLLRSLV